MNPSEIVIKILTVTAEGPKNAFYCTRTSSSLINSVFLMDRVDFVDHNLYRNSPNAGMVEFQEKLRLQQENSMHTELEKLLTTAKPSEAEISRKDFEGFKKLFHRFLQEKGPSVDWAKIQRPPEDSVRPTTTLNK
ncbi:hypothetical protein cypCar_00023535 [Cyprinus carpio]|nr:hypothetical protein cypCar_00023535 [Cyprinus carpio]